ncbi:MAG: hypothetical protein V1735_02850 [Nanoarchaeota archaeon]
MRPLIMLVIVALLWGCSSEHQEGDTITGESIAEAPDCPSGLVNDPYPGSCGSYVDADKDSICDHSQ